MAALPPPAFAPGPVVVQLLPANPEGWIVLDPASPVVIATPCLRWQPAPPAAGGAARVQLAHHQVVRGLLGKARISRVAADLAAAHFAVVVRECTRA